MKTGFYHKIIVKTVALFLVWILISESFDVFHMVLGFCCAIVVALVNTERSESDRSILRLRSILYFPWLVIRILKSGCQLSAAILKPSLPIDPKMVHYQTKLSEDGQIVLLGNSITLTPGTITVEVNDGELVVHTMSDAMAEDVTAGLLEDKISSLFGERESE